MVFAAKNDQMVSLLKTMVFNIASWERTLYGNDSIGERLDKCLMSSESAEAAYGLISGPIDSEFAFCFVPDIKGANGWLDEHRKDIEQLRKTNQTIESIVKYLSPTDGCLDNGFKFRDPGDSYDSETASVDMNRYGSTYVLRLDYCTRFVGNFESVDALISMTGLVSDPRADYGISHMCDYQMSWSGEGTLINLAVDDAMLLSELLEEACNNANMDLANEDNLQIIAWHVAECRWKETRWDDEEPLNAPKLFSSDAIDTGDSAIGEVDEFTEWAERILRLLPDVLPIEGTGYLGRAERVEKLNEGERLVVAGDWNNDNFGSVCLEVFNDRGETLGNLSIREDSEYASMLARVLPHLIVSAEKITPVSKRRKGSKYPLLDVRLELAPGITHDQFVTACKNNKDIDRSREVLFSSGTKLGKALGDKPFGQKAARNETGLSAARAGFVKRARKRGHLVTLPGIKRLRRHGEHARVAHQQVCEDHHLHRQSFLPSKGSVQRGQAHRRLKPFIHQAAYLRLRSSLWPASRPSSPQAGQRSPTRPS